MTKFQEKVYKAVADIPKGETKTYAQIAEDIGYPRAYRAVGNALNKNPFLSKVPCHRVICSNGQLGGYARLSFCACSKNCTKHLPKNLGGYVLGTKKKVELLKQERLN